VADLARPSQMAKASARVPWLMAGGEGFIIFCCCLGRQQQQKSFLKLFNIIELATI